MKLTREYRGRIIFRNTEPGCALRWSCLTKNGRVSADTLAGLKKLIRQYEAEKD